MPEAENALCRIHRGDYRACARQLAHAGGRVEERDLHFAFDELDWCKKDRGEGARGSTATDERRERKRFRGWEQLARYESFLG